MLLKNGEFYLNHSFIQADLRITDGRIDTYGVLSAEPSEEVTDLSGSRVIPGFFDVHTHGAYGTDVNAATPEELESICCFFARQGTTSWLGSVLTDTEEATCRAIDAFLAWQKLPHHGAVMEGIHLEGPFLSKDYKGAMPEKLLRMPDLDLIRRYQERAEGNIRYITVAPELPGVISMIPKLKEMGIQVAIGHSGASYETSMEAIRAGAMASTHTGNGMKLLHQHFPSIFGAALESEDLYCEMICDGRHLHPATVRIIIKAKGLDRVVAVTDSIMAAGLPDGRYKLGVNDVVVEKGDAKLVSDGTRAGSTLTTGQALRNLRRFTQFSLAELVPVLTENPAKLIGLDHRIGTINPGKEANLLVLKNGHVAKTMVQGQFVYEEQ